MNTALMSHRPVRELLHPVADDLVASRTLGREQRRHPRYCRNLMGQLITEGTEYPVTCVDMSLGGTQVVVGRDMPFEQGDRVTLQFAHNGELFQDDYSVVGSHQTAQGTTMNLAH